MKLLPNEEKLISSNQDKIILTDHRIQMVDSKWGQSFTISIFLEDISSIEIKYKSNNLLLILGSICVLGGFFMTGLSGENDNMIPGFVFGGIFFAIWWFTLAHIISISSNGGSSINLIIQGMGADKVHDFIHSVSAAKQKRVNQLHKI